MRASTQKTLCTYTMIKVRPRISFERREMLTLRAGQSIRLMSHQWHTALITRGWPSRSQMELCMFISWAWNGGGKNQSATSFLYRRDPPSLLLFGQLAVIQKTRLPRAFSITVLVFHNLCCMTRCYVFTGWGCGCCMALGP